MTNTGKRFDSRHESMQVRCTFCMLRVLRDCFQSTICRRILSDADQYLVMSFPLLCLSIRLLRIEELAEILVIKFDAGVPPLRRGSDLAPGKLRRGGVVAMRNFY